MSNNIIIPIILAVSLLNSCSMENTETIYKRQNDTLFIDNGRVPILVFNEKTHKVKKLIVNDSIMNKQYFFNRGDLSKIFKDYHQGFDTSIVYNNSRPKLLLIHSPNGEVCDYYSLGTEVINYQKTSPITLFYPSSHRRVIGNNNKKYQCFYNRNYKYIIGDLPKKKDYVLSHSFKIDSKIVSEGELETNFIKIDLNNLSLGIHNIEIDVFISVIDSIQNELTYSTKYGYSFKDSIIVEK